MPEKIKIKTDDGMAIAGTYRAMSEQTAPAVVLLHMMPATKENWDSFAQELNKKGFQCLAVDLRGHGESEGGPDGFLNFTDRQHQESIKDVKAAFNFFTAKGVPPKDIFLCGASIGANLALKFQAEHPEIRATILLSPGLNYRGLETEPMAERINQTQSVFFAAGGENDRYSTETSQNLFNMLKSENKKLKILKNAGHGTEIFDDNQSLMGEIILWIQSLN